MVERSAVTRRVVTREKKNFGPTSNIEPFLLIGSDGFGLFDCGMDLPLTLHGSDVGMSGATEYRVRQLSAKSFATAA